MSRIVQMACVLLVFATTQASTQVRRGFFALVNARIETVTRGVIAKGTVIIRDGKIVGVGADISVPSDAEVIDCANLTIYPGLIDGGTQLGLVEIGSIPETRDEDELGEITPQMEALTAVNPNSVAIPVTRTNGVTTVLTNPTGGLFPGTSALINLVGYTPEQMFAGFKGVVMNFPATARRRGRRAREGGQGADSAARKARERLDVVWDRVELASRIDSARGGSAEAREFHPEIDALIPVVRRQAVLLVEVNGAQDIDSAIAWVKRRNLRAIFTGVSEGWRVADHLASAAIPCIVGPVLSMPTRPSDRFDKAYANAGLLRKAGVTIAIRSSETSNARNLPFHAGYAATYGLGREEALRAVTIVPAQLFGLDQALGSIEVGKKANLFVADGDPFEPSTTVRDLFIDGYHIPLSNRQVDLYHEFLERSPGLTR